MEKYSLVGVDGNAFYVMAYVIRAMKREKAGKAAIEAYEKSAMSGDYDNLLAVSVEAIDKLNEKYLDEEDEDCEFSW